MTLDRIRQGYIVKPCQDCYVEDDMNRLEGGRQNIEEEEAARSGPIPESETSNARAEPSTPTGEPKHLMSMHGLQTHPNTIDDASRPSPSAYEFHVYYEPAPSPASQSNSTEADSMIVDVSNHDMPFTPKSRATSEIRPAGSQQVNFNLRSTLSPLSSGINEDDGLDFDQSEAGSYAGDVVPLRFPSN